MKYKKSFIFISLLIFLFSIASVTASDVNEIVGANEIDENGKMIASEEQVEKIDSSENHDVLEVEEGNVLSVSTGSLIDLMHDIEDADNELNLTRNYQYNSNHDTSLISGVYIHKKITINGNGFVINGKNKASAFRIISSDVVINNITFVNCLSSEGDGGAIYWVGDYGKLNHCTFENCSKTYGGAIYWNGNNGNVTNCDFNNCYSIGYGGAIYGNGIECIFNNCNFKNCYVSDDYGYNYGGAIYWGGDKSTVTNCNFENCYTKGTLSSTADQSFKLNCEGGAIYWYGNLGRITNCNFNKCYSYSQSLSTVYVDLHSYGGSIYWKGENGYLEKCNFTNGYTQCSSRSIGSDSRGGSIYWVTQGIITGVNIKNSKVYSSASSNANKRYSEGGAIYAYGNNIGIFSSIFQGNSAINGTSVCWKGTNGQIRDSILLSTDSTNTILYSNNAVNAQYNWWGNYIGGTNSYSSRVSSKVNINNRYYLDISIDKTSLKVGETAVITIDFRYINSAGSNKYSNSKLADILCSIKKDNTIINNFNVHDGIFKFNYLVENPSNVTLNVKCNLANIEKTFNLNITEENLPNYQNDNASSGSVNNGTVSGGNASSGEFSKEDNNSSSSSQTNIVKTSDVTTTLTKPATKTTLTLKKVKVKRSAKKLTIQSTLKVNGKAVKGKIIKFKFNKKSYKAKTNAKGVAKITVKKSVLKKLKKGKKVTYTATYGKVTKKVTVKVKK